MAELALSLDEIEQYAALFEAEQALCEISFYEFLKAAWRHSGEKAEFIDGPHLKILCDTAQALIEGEVDRDFVEKVMFNIPPGHTKSTVICVMLPAWVWGPYSNRVRREDVDKAEDEKRRDPASTRFVFTAYKRSLAVRDGQRAKVLMHSNWYQAQWGHCFAMVRENEDKQENDRGGYRLCVATNGVMGEGGDYIFLDDPHNVEEAESDSVRKKTNELLDLALYTRVRIKNGGIFLIMQRLHPNDYCGHLIANPAEYAEWQHICLPGRYDPKHPYPIKSKLGLTDWRTKPGQLLWPARYNKQALTSLIRRLKGYGAAAQIDQNPRKRMGDFFKRAHFERNTVKPDEVPTIKRWVRAWDLAGTEPSDENPDPDWTTCAKAGLGVDGKIYYVHADKFRKNAGPRNRKMKEHAQSDGTRCTIRLPIDPAQAGKDQNEQLVTVLFKGWPVKSVRPTGPKDIRAQPLQAAMPFDEVKFVDDGSGWLSMFIDDMVAFPALDDMVDAAADAYNELTLGNQFASGQRSLNG